MEYLLYLNAGYHKCNFLPKNIDTAYILNVIFHM